MAEVRPFAALRPNPALASRVCELPYDVMSEEEARRLVDGNPLSFLSVSRPETGLPRGSDAHGEAAYQQARAAFDRLITDGVLQRDASPAYYLYRQVMGSSAGPAAMADASEPGGLERERAIRSGKPWVVAADSKPARLGRYMEGHSQTGIVAAASCREYLNGTIRKHELTRPDKEDDRVRHLAALDAQTGPAFLFHRAVPELAAFIRERSQAVPDVDFVAPDGVRHSTWTVADREGITFIASQFAALPRLYIADGHHRSAAAARVFETRHGAGNSGGFLSVIFGHDALQILPYHRVLKDLNGRSPAGLLEALEEVFAEEGEPVATARDTEPRTVQLYLDGRWRTLRFRPERVEAGGPADRLDVALLQRHVLHPLFGIDNPRTSERIGFVGGIRGPGELQRLVDAGEYACAFAMHPTGIGELMEIADGGGLMPPKSTWFEPKLRDALFCLPL